MQNSSRAIAYFTHISASLCCTILLCTFWGQGWVTALQDEERDSASLLGLADAVEGNEKRGRNNLLGPSKPIKDDPVLQEFLKWLEDNGAQGIFGPEKSLEIVAVPPDDEDATDEQVGRVEYGILSARDLFYPETLISLPRGLWITSKDLSLHVEVKEGQDRGRPPMIPTPVVGAESDWDLATLAFLLNEKAKGNESFWAPYLRMFPACNHIPFMFSKEEILQLQYRPVIQKFKGLVSYMLKSYAHLKEVGALPKGLDEFKHVQWAIAIIWSRTFNVYPEKYDETEEMAADAEGSLEEEEMWDDGTWVDDIVDGNPEELNMLDADEAASGGAKERATEEGGGGERAPKLKLEVSPSKKWKRGSFMVDDVTNAYMILPFLDMLNHDFANQAVWDMSGDRVIMSASKRCGAGRPVYTSYGMKGNDDYFLYYGFLPDPNPYDSARLFSTRDSVLQWYVDNYVNGGWEGSSADLTAPIDKGFDYNVAVKVIDEAIEVSEAGSDLWRVWKEPAEGEELDMDMDMDMEETWRDNVRKELGEDEGTMFDLGPEYEFEEDNGFEVWPQQHVEPRLLAMLVALRYSHVMAAKEEGNAMPMAPIEWDEFNEIATGALNVGRRIPGVSKCSDQNPKFAPFFLFASQAIQDRVRQLLASYSTTLSEDVRLLHCAGVDIDYDEEDILPVQSCPWTNQTLSTRMKVIVKFRALKKQLLLSAARRLDQDCKPYSISTTTTSV